MDDPDATVPVPRPMPPGVGNAGDGERITESGVQGLFAAVPSTPRNSPREWLPPSVEDLQKALPQYEISAFIACGGMGAVYKGTQKTLKRTVAIKVLPPHIDDGEMHFSERFKHEAQAMARLTHPNIVAVHEAGETPDGLLYFVMEFVEGTDVHRLISTEQRLEPQRAKSITVAVCDALAFAHEEGIIHRDIKPSNIMLDKKGRVKVADFGLAKAVNLESTLLTGSNMAMGTADFMAPEALIGGMAVDGRADIYAVGVMLYQMLTGRIPRGRFALPSVVVPQIDPRLDAIVDKAMQTDREKRYSTAQEMKADVEKVQGSTKDGSADIPVCPNQTGGEAAKHQEADRSVRAPLSAAKSRKPLLIGTAAAVIVLAAGAFFARKKPVTALPTAKTVSTFPSLPVSRPYPAFPPGQWVKVMQQAEDAPPGVGSFAQWNDGWWSIAAKPGTAFPSGRASDRANSDWGIRAVLKLPAQGEHMPQGLTILSVRESPVSSDDFLNYSIDVQPANGTASLCLRSRKPGNARIALEILETKTGLALKLQPGAEVTMELFGIGDLIAGRVNGTTLGPIRNALDPTGGPAVSIRTPVRNIELINLNGLSESAALKTAGFE